MLTFLREDVERTRGLNLPDTPLKAPSRMTEVHTVIGRKVPLDEHGGGYFTAEEAKYLKLEGWTPAP